MNGQDVFELETGRVTAWHRVAVAIRCVDARTRAPVSVPLLVRREIFGPRPALRELIVVGSAATLTYDASVGSRVILRIEDPRRRWLPRRLALRPPARTRAEAAEDDPPGTYLSAAARAVDAFVFPGPAHPLPSGSTGARVRVTRQGQPVAWPRLQVFAPGGVRAGWSHGDEHGDALVLVEGTGNIPPPAPATFAVAVRVHVPDPAGQGPPDPFAVPDRPEQPRPGDPLDSLVAERLTPPAGPTLPEGLDPTVARGTRVPPGYITSGTDVVIPLTTGRVNGTVHISL
jgi:hypothetical protein